MNIAPKPPLARQGQQLASHGRYGDTELVHMNPYEVQGLAAMSPTGQLTTNPETGQPEAFLPMLAPLLAPMLGSTLGATALGGVLGSSALGGAIGSGLATWAMTGDFEKGLISGVTGFGLGKVLGAGADAANLGGELADVSAAQANVAQQTANLGKESAVQLAAGIPTPESAGFLANAQPISAANPGGNMGLNISPNQLSQLQAKDALTARIGDLDTARQGLTAGQRLGAFGSGEGLAAMGKAALRPDALLPIGVGLGTMGQVEQQEAMEKLRKETTARDGAYAQSFKNVLTDSLGMARGSEPNPYALAYSADGGRMASGGVVKRRTGGRWDADGGYEGEGEDYDFTDVDTAVSGIAGYGLDEDSNYYINPKKDSAGERQSFLRGNFKQDSPTDYRHGFEKEFQFFDFVEDRPIERYADLFGAGASDYLAGLLAGNTGDAPTTPTYKLDDVDKETLKTSNFSGIGPGAGQGGDVALAPLVPAGGTSGASGQTPVAGGTVAPAGGFIPAGTVGTAAPPSTPLDGGTVDDKRGVSAGMKALQNLNIDRDQKYTREEGESVYDIMQEYQDVDAAKVADYFFEDMYADDPIQSTKNIEGAAQIVADRYQAGEDFGLGRRFGGEGSFEQADVDRVYANLTGDEPVNFATAADYFNVSGDELQANLDAITSRAAAAEVLGDIPATDGDAVYDAIESGQVTVTDVANHYGFTYEEVRAAQDAITAQRAATGYTPPAPAPATVPAMGNIDPQELADQIAADLAGMSFAELEQAGIPYAKGGKTGKRRFMTRMGEVELAEGGLADVPVNQEFMQEIPPEMMAVEETTVVEEMPPEIDYNDLVAMTVEAVKGNLEDADSVINLFIEEYGVEKFRELRDMVLQSIVPDAQTEGMIAGSSGGMDDEVMGMIGETQRVAVSPGEYIVAADVVSGLGDGNSDAGADVLDDMMQGVRNARSGGQQPKPLNKAAVMPA